MRSFWFAVQFLTRLPTPDTSRLDAAAARVALARARVWFPLVGAALGGLTAAVAVGAGLLWPRPVAIVLALIVEALATGAFHEDAVADYCDAIGGGRTREDKLAILRDSRVGSYGALGLGLAVGLRAALLIALPAPLLAPALIASGAAGRWTILCVMASADPVPGRDGLAAGQPALGWTMVAVALALATPGLAWTALLAPWRMLIGLVCCLAFALAHAHVLQRMLGGTTGDALGFSSYAGALIMLLALAAR